MSTALTAPTSTEHAPSLERDMDTRLHLWTRSEYHRMIEAGLFDDKRVELLDGRIWEMPAQLTPHAVSVGNTRRTLEAAFGPDYFARDQAPVILNDGSEPEPDIVIVPGVPNDYYSDHPHADQIAVLVEVSDSTLRDDRRRKARAYARAGIKDYWIVNLVDRQLEIHREPTPEGVYRDVRTLNAQEIVNPLAKQAGVIRVADLLPPNAHAKSL